MASYNESFDSVLDKLLVLSTRELPDFTNYKDKDPLVLLIKLLACMSISSNKYSNKYLNSKFIQQPSTIDDKSIYLLLESFDLIPVDIVPGTVELMFEYNGNSITDSLMIPEGSEFFVGDTPFTTFEDYYIKAYNSYVNVKLIEGSYKTQEFYKSNITNKRLRLNSLKVSSEHVKLIVDNEEYTKIDHAEYSDQIKVFSVEYDLFSNYNIVLSDSTLSCINDSSTIEVRYIESTGTSDYDPISDPIILSTGIKYNDEDVTSNIVQSTISGYTMSDTTHTRVSNYEQISSIMPTFRQAISTEDYTNLTNFYSGIAIAKAYDIHSKESSNPEVNIYTPYLTKIVIAPTANYYVTDLVKSQLLNYLRSCGLGSDEGYIEFINPKYVIINITIGVSASTENQSELLDMYSTISETIKNYFRIGNIKYGSFISRDYISSLVSRCDKKINYVEVLEFSGNDGHYYNGYQLNAIELPLLGNLEIEFQFKNIALTDSANVNDIVSYRDVTYYLQGSRGDKARLIDNNPYGIIHEIEDSADTHDEKSFGYNAEFDVQLSQKSSLGIEYRLDNDHGEKVRLSDNNSEIHHELKDSADTHDEKSFGYNAEFDVQLNQESSLGIEYKIKDSSTSLRDDDNSVIEHNTSDESSGVSDEKSFGYDAEFNVGISQEFRIQTSEEYTYKGYSISATTNIVSNYSGKSGSDKSEVNDDQPKEVINSVISDRLNSFDKLYDY